MPLNEADTCRTYVLPKLYGVGWEDSQISELATCGPARPHLTQSLHKSWSLPQAAACK